jgi:hypothetical protein
MITPSGRSVYGRPPGKEKSPTRRPQSAAGDGWVVLATARETW